MPIHGRDSIAAKLPELRKLAKEAGRDPDELEVTVFGIPPDADVVRGYADAGISRLVFGLPPAGADQVLPLLDRQVELMEKAGG